MREKGFETKQKQEVKWFLRDKCEGKIIKQEVTLVAVS